MARFVVPNVLANPDGWGPSGVPEQFKDMPYQPFSKSDKLGKIADWTGSFYQDKRMANRYQSRYDRDAIHKDYAYFHDNDESTFHLVDTTKTPKPYYQRNRMKMNQARVRQERERQQRQQMNQNIQSRPQTKAQKNVERDRQRQIRKWYKLAAGRNQQDNRSKNQPKYREASVKVGEKWVVLESIDFPRLIRLTLPSVGPLHDLKCCGTMDYYDKNYDRVTTRSERPLRRINRVFHSVSTTDDPIIRQLAKEGKGNVFATDAIVATLMCCTLSVYSWDIVVQKVGNLLFFDKRFDSDFDLFTVNETASTEVPADDSSSINSPRSLALEATFINRNFSQQVLRRDERYSFKEPNPFIGEDDNPDEISSVGYRYRSVDLGNKIQLVIRCEHDAVMQGPSGDPQFINIHALNEWDPKYSGGAGFGWRGRLDTQRGAVLATELKNNSCKLAKWTVCALLAGSDQLKFGYVSRAQPNDSSAHVILGTQQFKPIDFALQINLHMDNGWGMLRCIIDFLNQREDGNYLIMKDPMKALIRIYDTANTTFDSEDEDDSDSDPGIAEPTRLSQSHS